MKLRQFNSQGRSYLTQDSSMVTSKCESSIYNFSSTKPCKAPHFKQSSNANILNPELPTYHNVLALVNQPTSFLSPCQLCLTSSGNNNGRFLNTCQKWGFLSFKTTFKEQMLEPILTSMEPLQEMLLLEPELPLIILLDLLVWRHKYYACNFSIWRHYSLLDH